MIISGISKVFSTENEAQYESIGAFWDMMSERFGRENLQGIGFNWTGHSLEYLIALKKGALPEDFPLPGDMIRKDLILPDQGWITREGRTEQLGKLYEEIYQDGALDFEIEAFNNDGTCVVRYFRKAVITSAMEVLFARHSYRGRYCSTPVPDKDLHLIADAGLAAPSGCNKQTTSLVVVNDPELMKKLLNEIDPPVAATAPAGIFVLTKRICAYRDKCFAVHDYSAAIENMLLAITAMGYASCWFEGHITDDDRICDRLAAILGIPKEYDLVCFLPVGIPETVPKAPKKLPNEERSFYFQLQGLIPFIQNTNNHFRNDMSIDRISHLVYKGTTTEAIQFVQDCKSEEELFVFVYNYNWENGLATPRLVMANPVCSMEIALLLFFSGDGYTFLSEGLMNQESDDEWVLFMKHLYASIVAGQYKAGKTAFKVPLTKVQIYKLKKQIDPEAFVLFTEFSGVDCNIIV